MAERPINVNINGQQIEATPDNLGIAMFRNKPDYDYLDFHQFEEGSDSESHILVFGQRELLLWMGGVALTERDQREIRLAERKLGSFALQSGGWRPPVFIEDEPAPFEIDMYVKSQLPKDEDWHIDLDRALKDEFSD